VLAAWRATDVIAIVGILAGAGVAIAAQLIAARTHAADRRAAIADREALDLAQWRDRAVPFVIAIREYIEASSPDGAERQYVVHGTKEADHAVDRLIEIDKERWPAARDGLFRIIVGHPSEDARSAAADTHAELQEALDQRRFASSDLTFGLIAETLAETDHDDTEFRKRADTAQQRIRGELAAAVTAHKEASRHFDRLTAALHGPAPV
jgi:hypothetical protein